jgi:hypothetical protein
MPTPLFIRIKILIQEIGKEKQFQYHEHDEQLD